MEELLIEFSEKPFTKKNLLRSLKFESTYIKENSKQAFCVPIPSLNEHKYENICIQNLKTELKVVQEDKSTTYIESEEYIFLRIEHDEKDFNSLEQAAYEAYKKIFYCLNKNNGYSFLRAWNYIPRILQTNNLERYREFNIGRWNAWQEYGPLTPTQEPIRPAATGIGSFDNPLIIEVLFTKNKVTYLENPRQKQFIHYSTKWGPKPPVSARGTFHHNSTKNEIFIAGTASLVGEEVTHINDVEKQTKETLKNIQILISKENLNKYNINSSFTLKDLQAIRVYVKNPKEDLDIIKTVLEEAFPDKNIMYLQDDICRTDFLLEIEAVAK